MSEVLLNGICRLCLKRCSAMHKLLDFVLDNLQIETILNQTIPFFDLEMHNIPLPEQICQSCLDKLKICFQFIQMCHKSNKHLKSIFEQQEMKSEEFIELLNNDDGNGNEVLVHDTSIILENIKKDPHDNNSHDNHVQDVAFHVISTPPQTEDIKLEVEMEMMIHDDDNREFLDEKHILGTHFIDSHDDHSNDDDKQINEDNNRENSESEVSIGVKAAKTVNYNRLNNKRKMRQYNFKCKECGKRFDCSRNLERHSVVHSLDRPFACEICKYRFITAMQFRAHFFRHKSEEVTMRHIKCRVCQIKFKTSNNLDNHVKRFHPEVTKKKCDYCKKVFMLQSMLDKHIKETHRRSKCRICKRVFKSRYMLDKHMRIHNGHICPHCNKTFCGKKELFEHIGKHTEIPIQSDEMLTFSRSEEKIKGNNCKVCGKTFKLISALNRHTTSFHSLDNPYECEICKYRFATLRRYKYHFSLHGTEAEARLKNLKCESCAFVAPISLLTRHVKIQHPEVETHKCDRCSKTFIFQVSLLDHIKEDHEPLENRECKICNRVCKSKLRLSIHMRTKHNPHVCQQCGKTISGINNLLAHIKDEHPHSSHLQN